MVTREVALLLPGAARNHGVGLAAWDRTHTRPTRAVGGQEPLRVWQRTFGTLLARVLKGRARPFGTAKRCCGHGAVGLRRGAQRFLQLSHYRADDGRVNVALACKQRKRHTVKSKTRGKRTLTCKALNQARQQNKATSMQQSIHLRLELVAETLLPLLFTWPALLPLLLTWPALLSGLPMSSGFARTLMLPMPEACFAMYFACRTHEWGVTIRPAV